MSRGPCKVFASATDSHAIKEETGAEGGGYELGREESGRWTRQRWCRYTTSMVSCAYEPLTFPTTLSGTLVVPPVATLCAQRAAEM